jgi:hypothetical protein
MSRTALCAGCRTEFDVDTATGPLPSMCDICDPDRAARRRTARVQGLAHARRRRDELKHLRERVAYLEQALAGGRLPRLDPTRPAGRDTVAISVRRVGTAEGARQTADRLRELAAEALEWADALGGSETTPILDLAEAA